MPVRSAAPEDAPAVADIYNYYIATSHATFELEPVDAGEMLRRMEDGWRAGYPFLIYEDDGRILGYAYGRQFRPRRAYLHSIETSVYIRNGSEGKAIGTKLYEQLFNEIGKGDFHAIIGGISLPNDASVRLQIPVVSAAILGFEGQLSVFHPYEGPCYRCLFPQPPPAELAPSCGANGVLGVLPGTMGLLQATEVVKLIIGAGEPLVGRLLMYDALAATTTELKVRRDPECPICSRDPGEIADEEMGVFPDYEAFCAAAG